MSLPESQIVGVFCSDVVFQPKGGTAHHDFPPPCCEEQAEVGYCRWQRQASRWILAMLGPRCVVSSVEHAQRMRLPEHVMAFTFGKDHTRSLFLVNWKRPGNDAILLRCMDEWLQYFEDANIQRLRGSRCSAWARTPRTPASQTET